MIVTCKLLVGYTVAEQKYVNIKLNSHAGEWVLEELGDWTADLMGSFKLDLETPPKPLEERNIKEMEPIHYEQYDYVLIACRNELDYTMAWAFAETRERLRMYEETRLSPLDLKDRLIAPFQNDMFAMVWGAFKNLYPDKDCEIYWEPQIRDEEDGKPVYGLTDFVDDGSVAVFVKPSLEVANAVEILAHELAHVAVGVEHDHDEVWQEAFDKIFEEYNRIGSQMFPNGEQCVMDDPDEK